MKEIDETDHYGTLLNDISQHIVQSRSRVARLVNRELLELLNEDERVFDHGLLKILKT